MSGGVIPTPPDQRVLSRIWKDDNGCWIFTGSLNKGGYGQVGVGSKSDGTATKRTAHQVMYAAAKGPVPDGMEIDHLCRVRACCNPDHLEAVPRRENLLRGETIPARHAARTHCDSGHELAGDNLRVYRGARVCQTCARARALRSYYRRKGGALPVPLGQPATDEGPR